MKVCAVITLCAALYPFKIKQKRNREVYFNFNDLFLIPNGCFLDAQLRHFTGRK